MIEKRELLERLNITESNMLFDSVYDRTLLEFEREGVFFLKREFLRDIQEKYHPFHEYYGYVMSRLERLMENREFSFFSLLLHRMLEKNRDADGENIDMFPREPFSDTEREVDFEFTGFFAQLAFVPEMAEYYFKRGLPEEHFSATLTDMFETAGIYAYSLSVGRLGYNNTTYFKWNQYYIYHKIVRIGQLNFEIRRPFPDHVVALRNKKGEVRLLAYNKGVSPEGEIVGTLGNTEEEFFADFSETEESYEGYPIDEESVKVTKERGVFPKSEWSVAIKPGDDYLNVHIPRGGRITKESNERDYREALRLHRLMFPEMDFKAIGCHSWLLSRQLKELLPESSNIVAFLSVYRKYPIKAGGRGVFSFLFPRKVDSYEELAEDTSLQRKVKALYLSGGAVIEAAGLIFPEDIEDQSLL